MKAEELRQFSEQELKSRIGQWEDELFRSRFKSQSSEAADTSIWRKLRRDIARGKTVLREKQAGGEALQTTPSATKDEEKPQDRTETRRAAKKQKSEVTEGEGSDV